MVAVDAFEVSPSGSVNGGFRLGLSRIDTSREPRKSGRKFEHTRQATKAHGGVRVADSKPPQRSASDPEPGAAGGQLAFHRELGARRRQWRQIGNERKRVGCGAIDFEESSVAGVDPVTAGLLLAALAFDYRRIIEGRGESSKAAMGANGAAEAGERGAQIVGRAPARADDSVGSASECRARSRPAGAAMLILSRRKQQRSPRRGDPTLPFLYHFFTANRSAVVKPIKRRGGSGFGTGACGSS